MLVRARATQVKSHDRMLNKLESADDHRDKPLPRPKWNVDTVRAGVIVHDAALLAQLAHQCAAMGHALRCAAAGATSEAKRAHASMAKVPSLAGQSSPSPPPHLAIFGFGRLYALWRSHSATQHALGG